MKKLSKAALIPVLVGASFFANAQFEDLIKGSKEDATYLAKGYLTPFVKSFGAGLNQGWYNTAKTHKFPGADLTISVSYIAVPSSEKKFYVDNTKLNELQLDGGSGNVPTILGSDKATGQQLSFKDAPTEKIDVPKGLGIPIAVPLVNLGIGLPLGIDVKVRYLPNLPLGDDVEIGMFGIGVMHDIKQHIPGIKKLPFDLAVFGGFTKFKTVYEANVLDGQEVKFDVKSTTLQVLISKKLAVLTVYGGVGVDMTNGSLDVLGTYDLDGDAGSATITHPVAVSSKTNSARITTGLRLKLGPITLHGDYTRANFNLFTGGFGISIR